MKDESSDSPFSSELQRNMRSLQSQMAGDRYAFDYQQNYEAMRGRLQEDVRNHNLHIALHAEMAERIERERKTSPCRHDRRAGRYCADCGRRVRGVRWWLKTPMIALFIFSATYWTLGFPIGVWAVGMYLVWLCGRRLAREYHHAFPRQRHG